MKKLKLESLEVTSSETAAVMPGERGTVHGNAETRGCTLICETSMCPSTPQMDCTFTCTAFAPCEETDWGCVRLTDLNC